MSHYLVLLILEFLPARLATLPHGLDSNTQLLANLLTKPSVFYYLPIVPYNLVSIKLLLLLLLLWKIVLLSDKISLLKIQFFRKTYSTYSKNFCLVICLLDISIYLILVKIILWFTFMLCLHSYHDFMRKCLLSEITILEIPLV